MLFLVIIVLVLIICMSPYPSHRAPRQPHKQTKDDHLTTHTTQAYRYSSKSEINLILQVNMKVIKNKLKELKLHIHNTHADIFTIQETKLTPKAKTHKVLHPRTYRYIAQDRVDSSQSLNTT